MSQIDEFLEAARQEGTVESAGQFTLDRARAEEYLNQYQLADKHHYLLKLVQCAVQAGASEIHFKLARDSVEATITGSHLDRFETSDVLSTMLQQSVERKGALKSLSIAISAALALDPISVEWCVWNSYHQERLLLDEHGCSLQKLSAPPFPDSLKSRQIKSGYLFRLSRKETPPEQPVKNLGWLEQLGQFWKGRCSPAQLNSHEHQLLSTKAQFAPIVVKLDGRTLNRPSDFIPAKLNPSSRMLELSILDASRNSIGLPILSEQDQLIEQLGHRLIQLENENDEKLSVSFGGEWRRGFLHCAAAYPTTSD